MVFSAWPTPAYHHAAEIFMHVSRRACLAAIAAAILIDEAERQARAYGRGGKHIRESSREKVGELFEAAVGPCVYLKVGGRCGLRGEFVKSTSNTTVSAPI
jgi:hypothetical protein